MAPLADIHIGTGGSRPTPGSVAKVPHPGEHHRDAGLVGAGDHFLVAHRAARLDHRGSTGLDVAIEAGVTAVIQPGGAMRDDEVIARANEAGIAMVFTGMRHFRH